MARYKECDYNQEIVVVVSLADQLLPNSLEYGIHILVETAMDLSVFDTRYKNDTTGCPAYHPKLLLKVVLFAYSLGIVGSRRIEKLCRKNVTCMALACGYRPDHSTIAAFVSSMQPEILSLFCDILLVCEEQQLLGGTVFALDGLKLPSNASKEWSGTFDDLKHKQEKIEAKLRQLLSEHQQADSLQQRGENPAEKQQTDEAKTDEAKAEEPKTEEPKAEEPKTEEPKADEPKADEPKADEPKAEEPKAEEPKTEEPKAEESKTGEQSKQKPKSKKPKSKKQKWAVRLKRLGRQAARIKDWLATHEPRIGKQGKEIQSNITDNESAKMATTHGVIQGYNAQAAVDAKNQIIIHAQVFGNGQDADHLSPMVAGAKANMQQLGHGEDYFEGSIWLADSNYHSDGNLKTCEEEKLDAYIPDTNFRKRDPRFASQERHKPPKRKKFRVEDFRYEEATDRYICPAGNELRLNAREQHLRYRVYRRYIADERDCSDCPLRAKCLSRKQTKRKHLGIPVEQPPKTRSQEMIQKIDTEEGRRQYSRRLEIVEPVFGNIRTQKRLDHFTLRGKEKVNIQWMLYSMVHNIEKIVHYGEVA